MLPIDTAGRRNAKSAEAFRTISEVADELDVPQHVLRFWESRFPQIKPLKRAGGRRYYRPDDVALLQRIRQCLYEQGYTIKGVQKLLRDGTGKTGDAALDKAPTLDLDLPDTDTDAPLPQDPEELMCLLRDLRDELVALRDSLTSPGPRRD